MRRRTLLFSLLFPAWPRVARAAESTAPSTVFDLRGWKLQIPGPGEVKPLANHASDYFYLNEKREMVFALDASEKGTTRHTKFVRSELRHEGNWKVSETRRLTAVFRVASKLKPDKVTVLQIHGITGEGDNAPPLLRIALEKGDLRAMIKTSLKGDQTEGVMLRRGLRGNACRVEVLIRNGTLVISLDGKETVRRDLGFWTYDNYFKAGCYPQALEGRVEVFFRELTAQ